MRDVFTHDFGWKFFSLLLAAIIWLAISTVSDDGTRPSRRLGLWETRDYTNLPILVTSSAADAREFRFNPEMVSVTVSGSPEIMSALVENEIQPTVVLTDVDSARSLLMRVKVSTPPGVTLIRVIPAEVNVVVPPKKGEK